jgi:hypothetical protein
MKELKQTIPFVHMFKPFGGVRTKDPAFAIPANKLQDGQNIRAEGEYIEKALGTSALAALSTGCDGLHYTYGYKGTARLIAFDGSDLKYWTGSAWATVTGGSGVSTAGNRWSFADYQGKTYMTNGVDEPLCYDPEENKVKPLGLSPLTTYTVLGYFESDETWTGGTAVDSNGSEWVNLAEVTPDDPKHSRKLVATTAGSYSMSRDLSSSPLDLTQFENGFTADDWDLFEFMTYHTTFDTISTINIKLGSGASPDSNYFECTLEADVLKYDEFGQDVRGDLNNKESIIRIPRARFNLNQTGSPDWSNITKITITLTTTGATTVYFDTFHFKPSPPVVVPLRKQISSFETGWSGGTSETQYHDRFDGLAGWKLQNGDTATNSNLGSLDLSKWGGQYAGIASETSDEIVIVVWRKYGESTHAITALTLKLGADSSNYYEIDISSDLSSGTSTKTEVRKRKDEFSVGLGSPNWNNINWAEISLTSSAGQEIVVSNLRMEQAEKIRDIAGVDDAESWTITSGAGEVNTTQPKFWPDENSEMSVHLVAGKRDSVSAEYTLPSSMDLTQWADGTVAGEYDSIGIWIWHNKAKYIDKIELQLISANGYYYYQIKSTDLNYWIKRKKKKKKTVEKRISDHTSTQFWIEKRRFTAYNDPDWTAITSVKVILTSAHRKKQAEIYFANIQMARKKGVSGNHRWIIRYAGSGFVSPSSEPSIWYKAGIVQNYELPLNNAMAMILNVKQSPNNVTKIEIFRYSDDVGGYFLEDVINENMDTTWVVGFKPDDDLGEELLDEEGGEPIDTGKYQVPLGTRNLFHGNEHWIWGVSEKKDRIFRSYPYAPHAFSESRVFLFDSEVLDVVSLHGVAYALTVTGIKQIRGEQVIPYDYKETTPSNYGAAKLKGGAFAFIGADEEIYLWDGGYPRPIGTDISDQLDRATYKLEESFLFAHGDYLYLVLVPQSGSTRVLWECYLPRLNWHKRGLQVADFTVKQAPDGKGELYYASSDTGDLGVYEMLSGYASETSVIHIADRMPDDVAKMQELVVERVVLLASGDPSDGSGTLTAKLYINGSQLQNTNATPDNVVKTFSSLNTYLEELIWDVRGDVYNSYNVKVARGYTYSVKVEHATAGKNFRLAAIIVQGYYIPRIGSRTNA